MHTTSAVGKLEPENNSGLNEARTHNLCNTDAVLNRLNISSQQGVGDSHFKFVIFLYTVTTAVAPSCLDSSVGRAVHQCCRGHGFELFQALISKLHKLCV